MLQYINHTWSHLYRSAFLLFAFAFIFAGNVSAQSGINLEAQAGLGGACKTGGWIPVRVQVENSGAGFEARVQASFRNDQNGDSVSAIDISLPASSRKDFFLYLYSSSAARNINVSVLDGKQVRAEKKLNLSCGANDLVFGVIADDPAPYNILNDIRASNGGRTRLARLNISDLPDSAQGWSALDALVISNVDTGKFTDAQKSAMQLWVANGGKLFVTGGIHWQTTTAGLRDFLPFEISSTRNVTSLSALSAYVKDSDPLQSATILTGGTVRAGGYILASQDGVPLLVEKRMGYGKIYFFAADPALQPLNDWQGMKNLYEHLLAFQPEKPTWAGGLLDAYQANSALSALSELNLPSFIYICCWLGLYILAVGPLNYFVLKRIKRTELAWLTIPLMVVGFSCLAYLFGFAYRGGNPILNRLAVTQGWDGVSSAQTFALVGVYSPDRETYQIESTGEFMLYKADSLGGGLQSNDANWLALKTENGNIQPDVRVEIGGMVPVVGEGSLPALQISHNLKMNLGANSARLEGTLTNLGSYKLRETFIAMPGNWVSLGDIQPGESKDIQNSTSNFVNFSTDIYAVFSSIGLPAYPGSSDNEDIRRRSALLQAVITRYNGSPMINSGLYLMGWVDEVPVPIDLRGRESKATDTLLYIQKMEPEFISTGSSMTLSLGEYEWQTNNGSINVYQIPADGYEIRLQPAAPIEFTSVDSLTLDINTSAPYDKTTISVWNFESDSWEVFDPQPSSLLITDAARYIDADGGFRVRLQANLNDYVGVNSFNFSLKVTR